MLVLASLFFLLFSPIAGFIYPCAIMFFPRTSPNLLSTHIETSNSKQLSSSSSSTSFSTQPSPSKRRTGTTAGNGAWSQPTTAPASVQVHYHYLAGRYRDLSTERGLGLVSSSSHATLGGILEGERDEADSLEGDARSINANVSPAKSASSSLRAIAKKNAGVKSNPSTRLDDLFLGGKSRRDGNQIASIPTKAKVGGLYTKIAAASHGAKHASLRSYAEERIKAHELIEARIERATDTGRLKWEAKAAILNNSYALAILLYTRAAQLGSVSASLSLSHLYSTGITRGSKPVVVLVHRDPLRSLSWAVEASRLLQYRIGAKAKRRGDSSNWAKIEPEQPNEIVALFARLLRCRQTGLASIEEVKLPVVRRRRSGKEKEKETTLWQAVCESMEWLDGQLPLNVQFRHDDGQSIGPDDDEADQETIKRLQARTQIALIEVLVATRRWAIGQKNDEKAVLKMGSSWKQFRIKLKSEGLPHASNQGDLLQVCNASEKLTDNGANTDQALKEFVEILNQSLLESSISVASTTVQPKLAYLESPSKRRANRLARRRLSLEELVPMDSEASKLREEAKRPSLLKYHSTAEAKPTSTLLGVTASTKINQRSSRSLSLQGIATHRPSFPSGSNPAHNNLSSLHVPQQERSTLQKVRRPSSAMSDSPSLLFNPRDERTDQQVFTPSTEVDHADLEDKGMPATSSIASSLWGAASLRGERGGQLNPRKRITSLYGMASIAPTDQVHTEGSTTFDYDINAALLRQQTRRRRGNSNASISTLSSVLSTNPSISESMAESEYAKGQFMTPSTSTNINGFDLRMGGAADSLRRIRKASIMNDQTSRDGPAAPQLTDTLEQLIANSSSYRAANAKTNNSIKPSTGRNRRDSNTSMRNLTAFMATNQRQSSRGEMRPPSLYRIGAGRAQSVLAMPAIMKDGSSALSSPNIPSTTITSYLNVTPLFSANGSSQQKGSKAGTSNLHPHGALGSLRLLGKQASSQSERSHKPNPTSMKADINKNTNSTITTTATKAKASVESPLPPSTSRRAFEAFDPTNSSNATTPKTMLSLSPSPSINASIFNDKSKATSTNSNVSNISNSNQQNHHHNNANNVLDPALAEAEEHSGLKTTSTCMICNRKVVNAPVSRNGDVFCSRECRIEMKKKRSASAQANNDGGKRKQI